MTSPLLLLTAILPLKVFANPLPTVQAGGPPIIPVPAACTIYDPLNHSKGYMPRPEFQQAHIAYHAYFETWREPSAVVLQCFQQCHGMFGCKSAFSGSRIPISKGYYGSPGGTLETGCILFFEYLTPGDFVEAPRGEYQNISAANICCRG